MADMPPIDPSEAPAAPPRKALADALARQQRARDALDEAQTGVRLAEQKKWEARSCRADIEKTLAATPASDAIIKSIMDGNPLKLLEVEGERAAIIEAATRDAEAWQRAMEAAKATIPERENELGWASEKVREAARAVLADETDVRTMLYELALLREQTAEVQHLLAFLVSKRAIPEPLMKEVVSTLGRQWLLEKPAIVARWEDAWDRLSKDAAAELPARQQAEDDDEDQEELAATG